MNKLIYPLFIMLFILSCTNQTAVEQPQKTPAISIAQIDAQSDTYLDQTVTVLGTVSGHLEAGSASGIWGETLVLTESDTTLYLKTQGNWIRYGTGASGNPPGSNPTEPAYGNNLIGTTILTKNNTYRLTGTITKDQYNPDRTILDVTSAELAN